MDAPSPAVGQPLDTSPFEKRQYIDAQGTTLPYRILLPVGYDRAPKPARKYPLILFLHGAGERGDDNERHIVHVTRLLLDPRNREQFPTIVIAPQCPAEGYWVHLEMRRKLRAKLEQDFSELNLPPTDAQRLAMELLDRTIATENVDTNRLYIVGMSMGALGTFDILCRHPDRFVAAVAVCGLGSTEAAARFAPHTAVWLTHGAKDDIVPVDYSRRMHAALTELGGEVKYTEFPDVAHNAWVPTFKIPDLLEWLFSHEKRTPGPRP